MTIALIPAYNEVKTIAPVVRTVIASGCFDIVAVIDDGSSDGTASVASQAGAEIVSPGRNLGKGGAMMFALSQFPGVDVAFFDADLLGLQIRHVRRMSAMFDLGYDMVCGFRDRDAMRNLLQVTIMPVITGERFVRRWVLDSVPRTCWRGYSIETAINDVCFRNGGRTAACFMDGVNFVGKMSKSDYLVGALGYLKMYLEMRQAKEKLSDTNGTTCEI